MELSPLETHLGYWLRYVSNHVSHAFSLKLAARGVTVAEWVVLRELYDAESAPSALAGRLGMTRGAISKLADRLIAKGLITRRSSAGDRRFQSLALTRQGRALGAEARGPGGSERRGVLRPSRSRDARDRSQAAMKDIVRRKGLRAAPVD